MNGKVKWYNGPKGFGFIAGEDGEEYYVHFTSIQGNGYKELDEDEEVIFEIGTSKYGKEALNIVRKTKEVATKKVEKIPNCPCCGGKSKYEMQERGDSGRDSEFFVHIVSCTKCPINTGGLGSKEAAISVWARRSK